MAMTYLLIFFPKSLVQHEIILYIDVIHNREVQMKEITIKELYEKLVDSYKDKFPHNPLGVLQLHIDRVVAEGKSKEDAVIDLCKQVGIEVPDRIAGKFPEPKKPVEQYERNPMTYLKRAIIGVSVALVLYGIFLIVDEILLTSYEQLISTLRQNLWTAYTFLLALILIFIGVNVFLLAIALRQNQEPSLVSGSLAKRTLHIFVSVFLIISASFIPIFPFFLMSKPLQVVAIPEKGELRISEGEYGRFYYLPVAWKKSEEVLFYLISHEFHGYKFQILYDLEYAYVLHDDDPLMKRCHEVAFYLHGLGFGVSYSNRIASALCAFVLSLKGSIELFETVFMMRIFYRVDESYIDIYGFTTPLMPREIRDFASSFPHLGEWAFNV